MNVSEAREILDKARDLDMYEADDPEDGSKIISEAEELVRLAVEAREDGFDNDEVTQLLDAAGINGNGVEPEADDFPIENYDSLKVSEIIEELPHLDTAQLAEIWEHESNHKDRPTVLNVLEDLAAEAQEPDSAEDPPDDTDNLGVEDEESSDSQEEPQVSPPTGESLAEPWKGYDKRTQAQILNVIGKKDDEVIMATYLYEEANKHRKGIMRALLQIASERGLDDGEEAPQTEDDPSGAEGEGPSEGRVDSSSDAETESGGEAPEQGEEGQEPDPSPSSEDGEDAEHLNVIKAVEKRLEEEHLVIPSKPPSERREIPFDMTEEGDKEIRQLYSASRAYFARAAYVAKREGRLAEACKAITERKFNEVIAANKEVGLSVTELKARAEQHPEVEKWRDRQQSHAHIADTMKKEAEIYSKDMDAVSREWTMRHEELEHSGSLPSRRGK